MLGWYRSGNPDEPKSWGCYYGFKTNLINQAGKSTHERDYKPDEFKWVQPLNALQLSHSTGQVQLIHPIVYVKKYEDYQELVETVNTNQNVMWKAGINSNFLGLTKTQINKKMGIPRPYNIQNEFIQTKNEKSHKYCSEYNSFLQVETQNKMFFKKSLEKSQIEKLKLKDDDSLFAFLDTEIDQINENDLPKEWDWRDINGVNYVPEVISQGNCGSCYADAFIHVVTSRLQIRSKNTKKVKMSAGFAVSCSFYTEGCQGGYPTLLGKFANEFYLAPEECFETPKGHVTKCTNKCENAQNRAKVREYGYIGGYYGAGSEANILKEIRARGPIIGSFEPSYDFAYYQSGIYHKISMLETDDKSKINSRSMRDNNEEWQKVDHSIVIVGWGEENGVKYWICQNSWDKDWGEQGYFKIKRGTNECSMESMPVFANPYFI